MGPEECEDFVALSLMKISIYCAISLLVVQFLVAFVEYMFRNNRRFVDASEWNDWRRTDHLRWRCYKQVVIASLFFSVSGICMFFTNVVLASFHQNMDIMWLIYGIVVIFHSVLVLPLICATFTASCASLAMTTSLQQEL